MARKVLLDTDIGSDIDDAVALAYLLAHPECELLGITTVSGQPVTRAEIASAICKAAGKEVPIYPGAEHPLLGAQQQPGASQASALNRWSHEARFPEGEAIEFMRRTIRQHPGEITLLTIGPMTNAALLFRADESVAGLLAGLTMMGGVFVDFSTGRGLREWNVRCDPLAAAIVYGTAVKSHRSVGLDVTTAVRMDADEVRSRFDTPRLRPVLDFAEVWFRERNRPITFHDPLAAASLFNPDICGFRRGDVHVELQSHRLRGMTHWEANDDEGTHEIAVSVDADRFFDHYFETVSRRA